MRPVVRQRAAPASWSPACSSDKHTGTAGEEVSMTVLGWILFGLLVGAVAKLLMPGRDPGGFIITILLGITGALLGGFVGQALGWYEEGEAAGFLMSLVGAIALLAIYRAAIGGRTRA
jgi:uncharacterized membrane protein YeaQ/YmgE (transglycosylase-associated protein family)